MARSELKAGTHEAPCCLPLTLFCLFFLLQILSIPVLAVSVARFLLLKQESEPGTVFAQKLQ